MATAEPLRLSVLMAHEPLVRAAARAVLRGDPAVDDVVQETWLAALQEGPREPRAVRGWLRSVARHRALNVLRERRRRASREQRAAQDEAGPDVAAICEREAVRRRLVEALFAEAEPYRSALLMRYYDDLPPRRIAKRLGLPVETVKTRIKRGLARLRARLGGDGPDRRTLAGIAGLAGMEHAALAAMTGGVLVASKQVLVAVGFVMIFVSALLWLPGALRSDEQGHEEQTPERVAVAPTPTATHPAELEGRKTPSTYESAWPAGAVRGIVVDAAGAPIAGASIRIVPADVIERRTLQRKEPDPRGDGYITATDAAGRFAMDAEPAADRLVLVIREGYEVTVVAPDAFSAARAEPARIVLHRGRVIVGRVESRDGHPVPAARVTVMAHSASEKRMAGYIGVTDDKGAFTFRFVPSSAATLGTQAHGYGTARTQIEAGAPAAPVVLTLDRSALLVHVVDGATGAPIADAGALLQTPDGRFRIGLARMLQTYWGAAHPPGWLSLLSFNSEHTFPHPEGQLHVVARGYRPARQLVRRNPSEPPPLLTVELTRGEPEAVIAGTVVGADEATIEVRVPRPPNWIDSGDAALPLLATTKCGQDGAFAISGVPPGTYRLVVSAEGRPSKSVEVRAPATDVRVDLTPGGAVDVQVEPATSVWVHVEQPGGRAFWVQQTDGEGRTSFEDLPAGRYRATIVPTRTRQRLMPNQWRYVPIRRGFDIAAGDRSTLSIPVPAPLPITLVIVDEDDSPRAGVRAKVIVQPGTYAEQARGADGMRIVRDSRKTTGADGRVAFSLFAGTYGLELVHGPQQRRTWIHVDADSATTQKVVLARAARRLRGRVVDADTGKPITGRRVEVTHADAVAYELVGHGATDDNGNFAIAGLPPARVVVTVATNLDGRRVHIQDNPYGSASVPLDLTRADPEDLSVRLRPTAAWLEAAGRIAVDARVVDAETQAPLAKGFIAIEVWQEGAWVSGFHGRLGEGGKLADALFVPKAERFRVRVHGSFEADPPYAAKTVEQAPVGEALVLRIALERDQG